VNDLTTVYFNPSYRTMLKPILLVEDNPSDLELTLVALGKSQLANEVIVARDGQEAIDYCVAKANGATAIQAIPQSSCST
jgi:CheY-like chemotaxis protein